MLLCIISFSGWHCISIIPVVIYLANGQLTSAQTSYISLGSKFSCRPLVSLLMSERPSNESSLVQQPWGRLSFHYFSMFNAIACEGPRPGPPPTQAPCASTSLLGLNLGLSSFCSGEVEKKQPAILSYPDPPEPFPPGDSQFCAFWEWRIRISKPETETRSKSSSGKGKFESTSSRGFRIWSEQFWMSVLQNHFVTNGKHFLFEPSIFLLNHFSEDANAKSASLQKRTTWNPGCFVLKPHRNDNNCNCKDR